MMKDNTTETNGYINIHLFSSITAVFFLQFLFLCPVAWGQNTMEVSGVITDANTGKTLPGVNILVKGTGSGTASDPQGEYSLTPSSLSDTLVFSYVGYVKQEIPIKGRTKINVSIQPKILSQEETVVIGYGTQSKKDLTGSVGTVDMESVEGQAITGANEALTGQISGVQVNTTNGIPGGGPQINIRGVGAIGAGNSPLYVVDGYPLNESSQSQLQTSNPLNDIPPSDIKSISVLKGPSATAIYGSRGANGVVQITTKKGSSGKPLFTLNAYTGWQAIPNGMKPDMMNAREYAAFRKQSIEDKNRVTGSNDPIPDAFQNPEQYGKGTNWYEEITRVAPTQNLNLSMSGGSENITSYFSANYVRQEGVVLGSNYNKAGIRANVTADITPNLEIGIRFSPSYAVREIVDKASGGRGGGGSNIFGTWEVLNPLQPVYNPDGTYNSFIGGPGVLGYPNPVRSLNIISRDNKKLRVLGSSYLSYDIIDNLSLKESFNVDLVNTNGSYFRPSEAGKPFSPGPVTPQGNYVQNGYFNYSNQTTINYVNTFKGGNSLKALGGISIQRQSADNAKFNGRQYPDDDIKTLNAAEDITGYTGLSSWALASFFGRINYSYKNRYLLTASIRRDGSSRFGSENRWGTFPSFALAWRVTEEPWMSDKLSWLSNLKLRGEYGVTGNDQIGNFEAYSKLAISSYNFGGNLAPGKVTNRLGNNNLTWQETKEVNLGVDIDLFNSRLSFSANYYNSNTTNLLLNVQIPHSSGFANATQNLGKVENKGLEFDLTATEFQKSNFSWSTKLNFSTNRNEVKELGPSGSKIIANSAFGGRYGQSVTQIGKPVGMFYGFNILGLFQNQDEIDNSASYDGAVPGALKVEDVNGDGKIVPKEDFTIIGNPYPDFTYGITNNFTYNNLSLNVVVTGSYGADRFAAYQSDSHNLDGVFNVASEIKNRWRSKENPGNGVIPTTVGAENRLIYRSINSILVKDASYLWVKNVKLGYNIPKSIIGNNIQSLQVYGSIQNAFLFTPYPLNPATERYVSNNNLKPGVDWNSYPTPRIMTVGVKLNL